MNQQVISSTFFPRAAFINALVFAVALVSRTALFCSAFQARHSANVIGWPFAGDMLLLTVAGALTGAALSGLAISTAKRTTAIPLYGWRAFRFNCLLVPLAFFLTFIFPHYFMSGVNFD